MPFFSVIIPAYNRSRSIVKAINSVLSQSYKDFEIIVVDDGSTDNTETVVNQIVDRRIKYFRKVNEERSIARNFGINKAQGRYVNFLDSDDVFYPNHLESAYKLLEKHHFPEIGHLGYEIIDSRAQTLLRQNHLDDQIAQRMLHDNILHVNAIFIRQDIAAIYQFTSSCDAVISEDWCLWMRLIARFKIYYDNTITSAVIEHSERSLRNINPDRLISSTKVIIDHLKSDDVFLKKNEKNVGYFFANRYTLVTLILALTKKRRMDTIKYLIKAIQYDYSVIFRKRFLASVKHWF